MMTRRTTTPDNCLVDLSFPTQCPRVNDSFEDHSQHEYAFVQFQGIMSVLCAP